MPTNFNHILLGGLPVYDPPANSMEAMNFFEMHTGAARYGWGKFLMRETDYEKLSAKMGPVTLVMDSQSPTQSVSISVIVAAYEPYSTSVANSDADVELDFVSVVVFDTRSSMYSGLNKQVNIQVQGFAMNGSTPVLYKFTTVNSSSSTPYTWANVFNGVLELSTKQTAFANLPTTWNPRNLTFDNTPKCKAIDIAAGKVCQIVGFNGSSVSIYDVGASSATNEGLLLTMQSYQIAGGTGNTNANARLPNNVGVTFRRFDNATTATDPTDAYTSPNSIVTVSTAYSGQYTLPLWMPDYVAVTSGSNAPVNATELNTVANDLTTRYLKLRSQNRTEKTYAGIWPVFPDGQIWGVRWSSSPARLDGSRGATTTLRFYDNSPFSAGDGMRQKALDLHCTGNGVGVNYGTNFAGPDQLFAMGGGTSNLVTGIITSNTSNAGIYNGNFSTGAIVYNTSNGAIDPSSYSIGPACLWMLGNEVAYPAPGGMPYLLTGNTQFATGTLQGKDPHTGLSIVLIQSVSIGCTAPGT